MNIFERVSEDLRVHHDQGSGLTMTPAPPPGTFAKTAWQAVHRDAQFLEHGLATLGDAVSHILPLAARIIASPQTDELVELVLKADGLGVGEEAFAAATAVLRDAMARHAAAPSAPVPPGAADVTTLAGENAAPVLPPTPADENAVPSLSGPQDEPSAVPDGPSAVQPAVTHVIPSADPRQIQVTT